MNTIPARFVLCEQEEVDTTYPMPKEVPLPKRGSPNSAGYDFYSPISVDILPGESVIIPSFIKCLNMPKDKVLKLYVRSSLGIKRHLALSNGTGIIDSDYVWCIYISLYNYGKEVAHIEEGERFVQGIFESYYVLENEEEIKEERKGGIGSTGKK